MISIPSRIVSIHWRASDRLGFDVTTRYVHGGGERSRTDGLLRARQALSQLSYTPKYNLKIYQIIVNMSIFIY